MLELIISYFLTKFNIITKKPNNPDCHLNHSVSMEEPNGLDATAQTIICLIFQKLSSHSLKIPRMMIDI